MASIQVTLTRSLIGVRRDQRDTVRALGLKKRGDTRQIEDSAAVRGMLNKVSYLLKIEG